MSIENEPISDVEKVKIQKITEMMRESLVFFIELSNEFPNNEYYKDQIRQVRESIDTNEKIISK